MSSDFLSKRPSEHQSNLADLSDALVQQARDEGVLGHLAAMIEGATTSDVCIL